MKKTPEEWATEVRAKLAAMTPEEREAEAEATTVAAAEAAALEAEKQAEARRVAAAFAGALVARGVTFAEKCVRCGQVFIPDARGACSSCGAPPGGKP